MSNRFLFSVLYSARSQIALFGAPFGLQLCQTQKMCWAALKAASAHFFRLPRFAPKCTAKNVQFATALSIVVFCILPLSCINKNTPQSQWKEISEISLSVYPDAPGSNSDSYLHFTLLRDGSAIKRDLKSPAVFNGNIESETFEKLSRAVFSSQLIEMESELSSSTESLMGKKIGIVINSHRKNFWLTDQEHEKLGEFIKLFETSLNKIKWKSF